MENEIPFTTRGEEDKPALVLIHGLLSSNLQWTYNLDFLEQHFYVVLLELWGHGYCGLPEQVHAFSLENYSRELEVIRHIIGKPSWHICGSGYGAGIAMYYARTHSKVVETLTISNSEECFNPDVDQLKHRLLHEIRGYENLDSLSAHPNQNEGIPDRIRPKVTEMANEVSKTAVIGALSYLDQVEQHREIQKLMAPLLIINGTLDKNFQQAASFIKKRLPMAKMVNVEAGNLPSLEAPNIFSEAVLKHCS